MNREKAPTESTNEHTIYEPELAMNSSKRNAKRRKKSHRSQNIVQIENGIRKKAKRSHFIH